MGAQSCQNDGTFAACSCENSDAGAPPDMTVDTDVGGPSSDMGSTSSCLDPTQALLLPVSGVATLQAVCSEEEIADAAGCISGSLEGASCDDLGLSPPFDMSAPRWDCSQCLIQVGDGDRPAAVVNFSASDSYLNVEACQAAAAGLPNCAAPVSRFVFCVNTACERCPDSASLEACRRDAAGDVCAQLSPEPECAALLNPDPPAAQCAGANFEEQFRNIGAYFCGG